VLVRRYQTEPVRHEVQTDEDDRADVRHLFWPAAQRGPPQGDRGHRRPLGPAIVFTRTKRGADRLARQLNQDGIPTAAIHGDRTQRQREQALRRFTQGEVTTLVATDVAARGIHVDDVGVVVHYDLPGSDKDYVHRSGRTGRAGARGVVITLVMDDQIKDLDAIQRTLELPRGLHRPDLAHLTSEHVPAPDLVPTLHRGPAPRSAGRGKPAGAGSRSRSDRTRARARR
jgi:superfamily II DNA/RNA helicase